MLFAKKFQNEDNFGNIVAVAMAKNLFKNLNF